MYQPPIVKPYTPPPVIPDEKELNPPETDFWKRTIVNLNELKDENDFEVNPYFTAELSVQSDNEFEKYKKKPNLPYNDHHEPDLKPMSNRFRTS